MSTNYSSSLVPNCIQQSTPTHPNNDPQRNTNRTPTNISPKSNQQLKSPIAKRPPNAKVTLQGWLHKQGSDGLQLWRKRWFVLSELCLYYYKSTEEDKLLGSVLLPSYRVSECRTEDKVGRKFAFKLEHANMRTYLLAAESHKSMLQWICALNLACMLQVPTSYPVIKSLNETSQKTQHYNNATAVTPNTAPQQTNAFQPLYENAPPKPRRVSESVRYMDHPQSYMEYGQTPQKYSHIIYANQHDQCMTHHMPSLAQSMHTHHVMERRTPDTYGRSNYDPAMRAKINVADYEDVYNAKSDLYEPPRSPLAYNHVKNNCPNPRQFPQQCNYRPLNIEPTSYRQVPHYVEHRKQPIREVISRPHSVDFLEHNSNDYQCRQPERPKSSLDINQRIDYESEKDFYSEQDYANKMRQSAMYLHYRSMNPKEYRNPSQTPIEATNPRYHSRYVAPVEYYGRQPVQHIYATNVPQIHREHHLSVGENLHRDNTEQIYNASHRQMGSHPVRSRSKSPQVRGRHYQNIGTETMPPSIETEKKREESMKRLIEWKQRMLQSPLNHKQISRRKYDQQMSRISPSSSEHRATPNMTGSSNGRYSVRQQPTNTSYSSDDEASGSVSIVSGHDGQSLDHSQWSLPDPCSRTTHSPIIRPIPSSNTYQGSTSQYYDESERYHYRAGSLPRTSHSTIQTPKRRQVSTLQPKISPEPLRTSTNSKGLKLSAGELLGRTHEELVLLLIQLRRQSISTYQAIEACHNEIDLLKSQMIQADDNQKLEHLQKLEQLNLQLLDLGKRYEKNKPLVNLVDNMVKLGSLYQKNGRADKFNVSRNRERLQFNQQVQERRLLAEERKDWEKLNLNHAQLQSKIQQLYELDNALRHESGTLAGLRKEKEYLEGALQSLQNRLSDPEHPTTPPAELERVRRHQQLLERELSRVHALLAYNSKKLEETVAGNARIEQELLVLRQKLQMTQRHRNQPYFSNTVPKERKSLAESVPEMEGELKRVQWLMGDLQKQRQELSNQVRHLTDKSQSLAQQMQYPGSTVHGTGSTPNNLDTISRATSYSPSSLKRSQSSWFETDLDICAGLQDKSPMNPTISHHSDDSSSTIGLFSTDTSDTQHSNSLHEKQEIKTVRIVKRESERRHRDRERTGISNTLTLATPPSRLPMSTSASFGSLKHDLDIDLSQAAYKEKDSLLEPSSNISSHVFSKSTDSLATYKSPNMLQVVSPERRTIPKEKRRHHTAPDNNHISRELSLLSSNSQGDSSSWIKSERSLDDLDMERALRPRINTPDVVRSTLGHKEIKYNERTIDNILGTPSKIIIPERYMPQDLPELSAEEERQRMRKVESIKKMLSDSTALPTTADTSRSPGNEGKSFTMSEEKRQRQHLLQLNQILAKQVIEMSKIVAGSKDKKPDLQ